MSLDKQVQIYSIDTSAFYNDEETKLHNQLSTHYIYRSKLRKLKNKNTINESYNNKLNDYYNNVQLRIKKFKNILCDEFRKNESIRGLRTEFLNDKNIISVFDSVLSRTLNIPPDSTSKDVFVVQTYFFDILKGIILNGFILHNEKYVCFTASAGQIRTKKTLFIKESTLLKYKKSLMCGLTVDRINQMGGVNINKYLTYLALCNSATDKWEQFDINRAIVVDDMETDVMSIVDFIDDKTYKIERKWMNIPITHTDGCGMILPRKSKKGMMVRLPWVKGLLIPFPFDKFIRESNKVLGKKYGVIKDIYGKEHDLIKDGIEVIFTKSQFKMWKYYSSWDEYKENYIKYNCQAGKCNEEDDFINDAKLNYQMLQTLTNITDEELLSISSKTKNSIMDIGRDKNTMLRVLGVVDSNQNKNYFQQALDAYPELLNDTYSKEILKQVKKRMVKEARAGKLDIKGKYTFIVPDLYAFCEYLILRDTNPMGLLQDGEVSCNLFQNDQKVDCLRSPHLYREHAIRRNTIDKEKGRWFVTKGLYTSCHDSISKLLMFDVDGDKSLVCSDETLIRIAERNMEGITPLYYNMAKAEAEQISKDSIYEGIKAAYTGGNIGSISNDITKIWNSDNVNLDVIKWLCMENNFTIDYAKTLYKVERPSSMKKIITSYTKSKIPHFFIYAKDKDKGMVEAVNDSVVNKLEKLIPNPRINFKATNLGTFDYKMLMNNKKIELNQSIIDKYTELDLKKRFMQIITIDNIHSKDQVHIYRDIHAEMMMVSNDSLYIVDVLIEYLYGSKNSSYKTTLWSSFGYIIVENIKRNLNYQHGESQIQCEKCGKRIIVLSNRTKYCESCWKEQQRELWKSNKRKMRQLTKSVQV